MDSPRGQGGKATTDAANQSEFAMPPTVHLEIPITSSIKQEDLTQDPLLSYTQRIALSNLKVPTLGGIALMARLGKGGMGAVYYGIHPRLHSEVAVKVLPLHLAKDKPSLVNRFRREAQVAARVKSNHLVTVQDVCEDTVSGICYLVMEYLSGGSAGALLAQSLKNSSRALSESDALTLCIAATKGLCALHNLDTIHRDIKPDNILIPVSTARQILLHKAKLGDLGLTKVMTDEDSGLTAPGEPMGTPGFMAPEQCSSAKDAGKPADVFGIGATLYNLLSGHRPFKGATGIELIVATMNKPHQPIREYQPEVSQAIADVIERCLQKNPAHRYQDANELLTALKACQSSQVGSGTTVYGPLQPKGGTSSSSSETTHAPGSPVPLHPRKSLLGWVVAALVIAGLVTASVLLRNAVTTTPSAVTNVTKEASPKHESVAPVLETKKNTSDSSNPPPVTSIPETPAPTALSVPFALPFAEPKSVVQAPGKIASDLHPTTLVPELPQTPQSPTTLAPNTVETEKSGKAPPIEARRKQLAEALAAAEEAERTGAAVNAQMEQWRTVGALTSERSPEWTRAMAAIDRLKKVQALEGIRRDSELFARKLLADAEFVRINDNNPYLAVHYLESLMHERVNGKPIGEAFPAIEQDCRKQFGLIASAIFEALEKNYPTTARSFSEDDSARARWALGLQRRSGEPNDAAERIRSRLQVPYPPMLRDDCTFAITAPHLFNSLEQLCRFGENGDPTLRTFAPMLRTQLNENFKSLTGGSTVDLNRIMSRPMYGLVTQPPTSNLRYAVHLGTEGQSAERVMDFLKSYLLGVPELQFVLKEQSLTLANEAVLGKSIADNPLLDHAQAPKNSPALLASVAFSRWLRAVDPQKQQELHTGLSLFREVEHFGIRAAVEAEQLSIQGRIQPVTASQLEGRLRQDSEVKTSELFRGFPDDANILFAGQSDDFAFTYALDRVLSDIPTGTLDPNGLANLRQRMSQATRAILSTMGRNIAGCVSLREGNSAVALFVADLREENTDFTLVANSAFSIANDIRSLVGVVGGQTATQRIEVKALPALKVADVDSAGYSLRDGEIEIRYAVIGKKLVVALAPRDRDVPAQLEGAIKRLQRKRVDSIVESTRLASTWLHVPMQAGSVLMVWPVSANESALTVFTRTLDGCGEFGLRWPASLPFNSVLREALLPVGSTATPSNQPPKLATPLEPITARNDPAVANESSQGHQMQDANAKLAHGEWDEAEQLFEKYAHDPALEKEASVALKKLRTERASRLKSEFEVELRKHANLASIQPHELRALYARIAAALPRCVNVPETKLYFETIRRQLPWPTWDGRESVREYASLINLPPEEVILHTSGARLEFVLIPAGTFKMGSPEGELGRKKYELQHSVIISKPFYLGQTEVTQQQYELITRSNPSKFLLANGPVEMISWHAAKRFTETLSTTGRRYRLPTEAEWEYACRAGSETPFNFGESIQSDVANYYGDAFGGAKGEYRKKTVAVRSFPSNSWGLFEMHGNVWEWCEDWWGDYPDTSVVDPTGPQRDTGQKVMRGGSWYSYGDVCRSARRDSDSPGDADSHYGFRLVLEVNR